MPTRNVHLTEELVPSVPDGLEGGSHEESGEILQYAIDVGDASGIVEPGAFERVRRQLQLPIMNPNVQIDWSGCRLVERVPDRMSNVPILVGTRVQADSIVENFWGGSPVEEISENFSIPEATITELLAFAKGKENHAR